MKKLAFIFTVLVSAMGFQSAVAQQDMHFPQYLQNRMLLNPAMTGAGDDIHFTLMHRRQWASFENSPTFQTFSVGTPIRDKNLGVGLIATNESLVGQNNLTLQVSASYFLDLAENGRIYFGLAGGIRQFQLDVSELLIRHPDDALFAEQSQNSIRPDFSFGMAYQHEKFEVGLSSLHLIEFPMAIESSISESAQARHYYAYGLYRWQVAEKWQIQPSALLKLVGGAPAQADLNVQFNYDQTAWAGLGYRTGDALVFCSGVHLDRVIKKLKQRITVGYAFDHTVSAISASLGATHELLLSYRLKYPSKKAGQGGRYKSSDSLNPGN